MHSTQPNAWAVSGLSISLLANPAPPPCPWDTADGRNAGAGCHWEAGHAGGHRSSHTSGHAIHGPSLLRRLC